MADTKISAMTVATNVLNADVVPIVSGGANFQATRQLLLTAGATEVIELVGDAGGAAILRSPDSLAMVSCFQLGTINIVSAQGVNIKDGLGATKHQFSPNGSVLHTLGAGIGTFVASDGGINFINVNSFTNSVTIGCLAGNFVAPFLPAFAGNWAGAPPTVYQQVLNRLENAVAGLLGGPIP